MVWNWIWSLSGEISNVIRSRAARKHSPRIGRTRGFTSRVEFLEQRLVLTPTSDEQLFVYLLNKIRHDPQAYDDEQSLGGILDSVQARPPLAVNADLFDSARFHAVEMADNNYFAHQSAVTGDWPNKMAEDQGYDLPFYFELDANYIESIAGGNAFNTPAVVIRALIVDAGIPSLGHRRHLLGMDDYAGNKEIGIGHGFNLSSAYDHYWAAHITFSDDSDTFLTGVVYQDTNANQAFSLNEGLAGVTVSINGQPLQTQTNTAGGWSIQVPGPGTYTVQVSGGSFVGTATSTVVVGADNREIDFISGSTTGVVDFNTAATQPNDAPENTVPAGPLNFQEDTLTNITGISVSDPDAGTSNVRVTLSVGHGTIQVLGSVASGVNGSQITGNNTSQVVVTAPISAINTTLAAAAGLRYRGASNYAGSDLLTVLTSDLGNVGTGGPLTDSDTVDLVVDAVNDAPVVSVPSGPLNVVTGQTLNVNGLSVSDVDIGSGTAAFVIEVLHGTITVRVDVAAGLTDADVSGNGTNSVVIEAPLSKLLATLQATGGVTYVSTNGYVGSDTLRFLANDMENTGTGGQLVDEKTVAIQVNPVPLPPIVTLPNTPISSTVEKEVVIGTGGTISDPDSPTFATGKLTVQVISGAQATDQLTLHTVGRSSGLLNLRKSDVRLGKTVIGHLTGGANGSAMVIQFTSNVSLSTVQTVLANITLRASKKRLLPGTRTIQFVATDPTNLSSTPQTRDVNVTA